MPAAAKPKTLWDALLEARKEFAGFKKDRENPFFHSKYAPLESMIPAVEPALTKHGLVLLQPTGLKDGSPFVSTKVVHAGTGEFVESVFLLPGPDDIQKVGSAITYGRRQTLSALLSLVADTDEDGNASRPPARPARAPAQAPTTSAPAGQTGDEEEIKRQYMSTVYKTMTEAFGEECKPWEEPKRTVLLHVFGTCTIKPRAGYESIMEKSAAEIVEAVSKRLGVGIEKAKVKAGQAPKRPEEEVLASLPEMPPAEGGEEPF